MAVVSCAVMLAAAAVAAGVEGLDRLIGEAEFHGIGQTEPNAFDRERAREAGVFWLVIATVLT